MSSLVVVPTLIKRYDWNDWYRKISEFSAGLIHIHEDTRRAAMDPGHHIVIAHLFQDQLPSFVQEPLYPAISHMMVFCLMGQTCGPIHVDGDGSLKCALNIPVRCCKNSVMEWFSQDQLTSLVREEIRQPALVRTDVCHRIDNTGNCFNRYMASIRFKDNPEFDDVDAHLTPR